MKFVNPYFLFALFSLAIPVIIHLFNFRRFRKVYFTNVRFLREVKQETQSRNRLKHLLVLACRCLTLIFLVLAFAQPYLPVNDSKVVIGDKAVSIYVDNSFSMDAVNKSNTALLKEAKDAAAEILDAYKPTDRFQLLTNDFEGRHQRWVNKEEFLELLEEVKASPAVRTLSEVVLRQQDMLSNADGIRSKNKLAFLVSDFQESISDFSRIKTDTSIIVRPVPVIAQNRNNVYIDSCWFSSPVRRVNQQEALHVRLRSRSDQSLENVPMKLFINGQPKTPGSFSIEANSTTDTVIFFTVREPGLQQAKIEINDYPVTFDNSFYFSFEVLRHIPVLHIRPAAAAGGTTAVNFDAGNYVSSLMSSDSAFRYTAVDENKIDYASLSGYRMIILDNLDAVSSGLGQELKKFVQTGGSIFVFPSAKIEPQGYNDFLTGMNCNTFGNFDTTRIAVDKINYDHPLYAGVFERRSGNIDLPVIRGHYPLGRSVRTTQEELLKLRNGEIFACSNTFGKGKVYLCTAPLDPAYSNFAQHAVFVPTLYQAVLFSQPQNDLFYTIGKSENIHLPGALAGGDNVFHASNKAKNFDVIPVHSVSESGVSINLHRQITEPGNYIIKAGEKQISGIAFNYDRKESDLTVLSPEDIKKNYTDAGLTNFSLVETGGKDLTSTLAEIDLGVRLWKWCIWLALIFLLAEVLLLRLWNTQKKPTAAATTA
ncbi:MAG: hypothetical protein FD123_3771 [Bacteroidetes bacterium]|nr:MAG: hypothetical protein FD123_3771 [Bacteroidota bacterium]